MRRTLPLRCAGIRKQNLKQTPGQISNLEVRRLLPERDVRVRRRELAASDALFFTDLDAIRLEAGRSITGTAKDGGWMFLGGTQPFYDWSVYMRAVDRCRAVRGE